MQGDEDMGKLWELAKLLWNSDMAAAYTQLASAGNSKFRDNLFFELAIVRRDGDRQQGRILVFARHVILFLHGGAVRVQDGKTLRCRPWQRS